MTLRWPAEAIWESLAPHFPGFTVEVLPEVDSSNAELMRRAKAGQAEPVLLVAERQTAGRGRLGRAWNSGAQPGDLLMFSLGLPLQMTDWSGLSLAVGLSLAQGLHPSVQLKWPNDLWRQDRKLAGVLIEALDLRYAVIGVGLNINAAVAQGADGMNTQPAWAQEFDPALDAPAALLRLAAPLAHAVLRFQDQGFAPVRVAWQARDALAGRAVRLSDGMEGLAQGVDERGALLVHTADGMKRIDSAEVSVRPMRA
ncbi:biotin--[acetyl-CoA-carboxylase] ligase [Hylemonella gracilis]|uniref:biotin--[biotin carboxyl-carrier protein] ligase n=1 Tax=Hylemonella gracilis TaxID=80880 RepID=A0A4P6UI43_9BURK|nr:biotin--[acetyl-CoA-carboxylase] ligase [Hylemonella gracilis]QBK04004.1 biotin--[acetyl-CoA-carboxylase] ligase [Hylemonella gracilis]